MSGGSITHCQPKTLQKNMQGAQSVRLCMCGGIMHIAPWGFASSTSQSLAMNQYLDATLLMP